MRRGHTASTPRPAAENLAAIGRNRQSNPEMISLDRVVRINPFDSGLLPESSIPYNLII
jgi:hypothetical protein